MTIYKTDLTEDIIHALISLSEQWEKENICHGYRKNTVADLEHETVFLAEECGKILGYLFCHTYTQETDTITLPVGSKCLEIEELYVIPEYRSRGIGKMLHQFAEADYASNIDFVTLSTPTKNYKEILHFYIDELDMTFWSARIFKKVNG